MTTDLYAQYRLNDLERRLRRTARTDRLTMEERAAYGLLDEADRPPDRSRRLWPWKRQRTEQPLPAARPATTATASAHYPALLEPALSDRPVVVQE